MNQRRPTSPDIEGLDRTTLEHMLSLGGSAMRPLLLAQIRVDLVRLQAELASDDPIALARTAHEAKGLCATIGAHAAADQAARLDSAAGSVPDQVRTILAQALQREIARLVEILGTTEGHGAPA